MNNFHIVVQELNKLIETQQWEGKSGGPKKLVKPISDETAVF